MQIANVFGAWKQALFFAKKVLIIFYIKVEKPTLKTEMYAQFDEYRANLMQFLDDPSKVFHGDIVLNSYSLYRENLKVLLSMRPCLHEGSFEQRLNEQFLNSEVETYVYLKTLFANLMILSAINYPDKEISFEGPTDVKCNKAIELLTSWTEKVASDGEQINNDFLRKLKRLIQSKISCIEYMSFKRKGKGALLRIASNSLFSLVNEANKVIRFYPDSANAGEGFSSDFCVFYLMKIGMFLQSASEVLRCRIYAVIVQRSNVLDLSNTSLAGWNEYTSLCNSLKPVLNDVQEIDFSLNDLPQVSDIGDSPPFPPAGFPSLNIIKLDTIVWRKERRNVLANPQLGMLASAYLRESLSYVGEEVYWQGFQRVDLPSAPPLPPVPQSSRDIFQRSPSAPPPPLPPRRHRPSASLPAAPTVSPQRERPFRMRVPTAVAEPLSTAVAIPIPEGEHSLSRMMVAEALLFSTEEREGAWPPPQLL